MHPFEIIQTPINKDHNLSYDVKNNVLECKRKPGLHSNAQNGRVLLNLAKPPSLMVKMVNCLKQLSNRNFVQDNKTRKLLRYIS